MLDAYGTYHMLFICFEVFLYCMYNYSCSFTHFNKKSTIVQLRYSLFVRHLMCVFLMSIPLPVLGWYVTLLCYYLKKFQTDKGNVHYFIIIRPYTRLLARHCKSMKIMARAFFIDNPSGHHLQQYSYKHEGE